MLDASVLRAEAAALRGSQAAQPDWTTIRRVLGESYAALDVAVGIEVKRRLLIANMRNAQPNCAPLLRRPCGLTPRSQEPVQDLFPRPEEHART
jgi:hypothetical protein